MRNFCTAVPGSAQWALEERVGTLICTPPDDARGFADSVTARLDDPGGRVEMSARDRKYVEQQATREVVLERYAEFIDGKT